MGSRNVKKTTTKCIVWCCLINGIAWVWCSYILAFLGKTDIAEGLSKVAVTEIIGVVLVYCAKSLFEKREGFGAVGKGNNGNYPPDGFAATLPDKGGQGAEVTGGDDTSSTASGPPSPRGEGYGDKYTRDL